MLNHTDPTDNADHQLSRVHDGASGPHGRQEAMEPNRPDSDSREEPATIAVPGHINNPHRPHLVSPPSAEPGFSTSPDVETITGNPAFALDQGEAVKRAGDGK